MHKKLGRWLLIGFISLGVLSHCFAADMSVQLTTSDGSTKFSIQNSGASEVASVDSQGNATFAKVTQTGGGGSFILNQNSLQAGATFYVSSGTVSGQFTAGSVQMPSGAHITVGSVAGTFVPSGTLILTTSTCPTGFTEYTAAGGFYLVGVPVGGPVGGTVGSAMTDLANATHNHTVTTTTATFSTLIGGGTAVTSVTSPTGNVVRGTVAPYFQIRLCQVP